MYAIGDMTNRHFRIGPTRKKKLKDPAAHCAMQTTDPVDRATPTDGQVSHIERLIRIVCPCTAQSEQIAQANPKPGFRVSPEITLHQAWSEAIEAGRDRSMRRKQI